MGAATPPARLRAARTAAAAGAFREIDRDEIPRDRAFRNIFLDQVQAPQSEGNVTGRDRHQSRRPRSKLSPFSCGPCPARGPAKPPVRNQALAEGGRAQHDAGGDADSERKRAWPRACPSGADVRPARRAGRCASREPGNRAPGFRIGGDRAQRRSPVGAAEPGRASASTRPGEAPRAQSGAGGGRTCVRHGWKFGEKV